MSVTPDAQDPLPEGNWLWRRVFVFLVTGAIMVLIYRYGDRLSDIAAVAVQAGDSGVVMVTIRAMLSLMSWLLSGLFLMITFYLLAPSAEQVIRAVQVAKSLRGGVIFSAAQRTTAEGAEDATQVTGKPIRPPEHMPEAPAPAPSEQLPDYAK